MSAENIHVWTPGFAIYNKKSISEFELNDSFDTLVHINPDPDTNPVLPQRLIEKVFNQDNSNWTNFLASIDMEIYIVNSWLDASGLIYFEP